MGGRTVPVTLRRGIQTLGGGGEGTCVSQPAADSVSPPVPPSPGENHALGPAAAVVLPQRTARGAPRVLEPAPNSATSIGHPLRACLRD